MIVEGIGVVEVASEGETAAADGVIQEWLHAAQ